MSKSKYILHLFIVGLSFIVTACCTPTPAKVQPIVTTVTIYKSIPTELLVPCHVTAPPAKDVYLAQSASGKEDMLTKLTNSLYTDLNTCNIDISSIKTFDASNQKLYGGQ